MKLRLLKQSTQKSLVELIPFYPFSVALKRLKLRRMNRAQLSLNVINCKIQVHVL